MAAKYFVWVNGLRGPEPQIWHDDMTVDGKPVPILAKHQMTDADNGVTLFGLSERYPYKAKE